MSDIHVIPTKLNEMQAALDSIKRALPIYVEMASINAQIRSAHCKAYLAQGFSEDQSLILCQRISL